MTPDRHALRRMFCRCWPVARTVAMRAALLGLMGALAGCASLSSRPSVSSADEPDAVIAIPDGWSSADAAGAGAPAANDPSLAAWWERFDDPQLGQLVALALRANTSIRSAQAALRQAQALRDVAFAALSPTLDGSASAQDSRVGGERTGNRVEAGLDASWTIDVFGARRAAVDAAASNVLAVEMTLGDTQVQIAAEVALNYILLRVGEARTVIALANLSSQEETLQITQWREQAGLATALETEQARASVEQGRALLPVLATGIGSAQHALDVLTGRPPSTGPGPGGAASDGEDRLQTAVAAVPQARDGLIPVIPAQALRQRADVRAAEYRVAAALAGVGQAQAQRWPSFSIGGSLGLGAATVGALGSSGALLTSLLANVALPVFDGGALRAKVSVQQALLGQAREAYRAAVLGALRQVEDALVALRNDRMRLASLRLAAAAAGNAALLARQRYGSGLVDFQVVLETQRTQFATQDSVASASADVGSGQVRLYRALGGGWAAPAADR